MHRPPVGLYSSDGSFAHRCQAATKRIDELRILGGQFVQGVQFVPPKVVPGTRDPLLYDRAAPVSESTTFWVQELQAGNREAAQQLWERYYSRLVGLARKRLSRAPGLGLADEDDIAQSAFASFYRAAEQGRFPRLADRNDLWRLLIVIAQRKISCRIRHQTRKKRLPTQEQTTGPAEHIDLDAVAGDEPTPEFCVAAVESFCQLLGQLDDSTLRSLALLKMEGYTNQEIAERLDCSESTVERKLRRIRLQWSKWGDLSEEQVRE